MVEIHTTRSSLLSSYGYDEAKKELIIIFLKGTSTYKYFDVPKEVYEAMTNAESIGKYFLANIKDKYEFEKE